MMSVIQQASTSVFSVLWQSVGAEVSMFVLTLVLAVTFRGAFFAKHTGTPKSLQSPKLKPSRVEQQGDVCAVRSSSHGKARPPKHLPTVPCTVAFETQPHGSTLGRIVQAEAAQRLALAPDRDLSRKVWILINCAIKRQDAEAIARFEEIRASGKNASFQDLLKCGKSQPFEAYNLLVQSAVRIGRTELIKVFLEDMTNAGIRRPLAFYKSMMKVFAGMKYTKEALSVCDLLEADGLQPSIAMLDCFVSFAEKIGDSDRAISFFTRLAACSTPSIRAYMSLLHMYCKQPNWPKSVALLRDMQNRQVPIDSLVLNIVLSTGVAAEQLEDAKALLQEFLPAGTANVISYNTIMKGFSQQKYGDQAIKLLDEMGLVGIKPNAITFNTAMDAAVRSLRVADAWQVLARMFDAGLTPDKYTCTVLVKGLHCGATSEQLVVILDLMQDVTQECGPTLCAPLLRRVIEATARLNDPDVTARALAQVRNLRAVLPPQEYQRLLQKLM